MWRMSLLLAAVSFTLSAAAGEPQSGYRSVVIENVPHVRQKPDFCGEACAAMWLQKLGHDVDQDAVFDQSGLDPLQGRGCYTRELSQALQAFRFQAGPIWHTISAAAADAQLQGQFAALHADLVRGVPSIVCMHYDDRPNTTEHFRLVVGYDRAADEVIYHEPARDNGSYRRMSRATFLKLWPLKYDPKQWTVIRMRLAAEQVRIPQEAAGGFTDADYAQHMRRLKAKLPEGFHVVLQKPFFVIGDEPPAQVRRRAAGTVKWAVDKLKQDYFKRDPHRILDIWLFKDKASYEKHCQELFGSRPTTPYGFYSARHRALVMNISTGGGTLVHEIVHPFMASNFPACPSWFNEGLASLYEQSGEKNGRICGYTNWRLRGLQRAIRGQAVPSFKKLCQTSTHEFYHEDPGTNYAQARYLCYYLQERGLLVKYYHAFRRAAKNDPGGYATLQQVLGEDDMAAFKKKWEEFVIGLKF